LSANIDSGAKVQSYNCLGCHEERLGYDFETLKSRIVKTPMFFQIPGEISLQELADLTAYLNRFNSP
ncbi:MAG: hypothetical protein KDD53_02505, partial [Bdellovibrionales bacterium]|nr:hypothetical protein [Bdellovibrionales bacterium]